MFSKIYASSYDHKFKLLFKHIQCEKTDKLTLYFNLNSFQSHQN